jgi:hypothetical protein
MCLSHVAQSIKGQPPRSCGAASHNRPSRLRKFESVHASLAYLPCVLSLCRLMRGVPALRCSCVQLGVAVVCADLCGADACGALRALVCV